MLLFVWFVFALLLVLFFSSQRDKIITRDVVKITKMFISIEARFFIGMKSFRYLHDNHIQN